MKVQHLRHEFVESFPRPLQDGILFVSVRFATAAHNCCCGCGNEVITPLTPTDWRLIFDGKTVSLAPSIGNWGFPCRSHYWIRRNRVIAARPWSADWIEAGRAADAARKQQYYADPETFEDDLLRADSARAQTPRRRKRKSDRDDR
jgi:hypothetical protein